MDHADMADKHTLEFLDRAIAAARGIRTTEILAVESEVNCSECGDEIPLTRRQIIAGCKHCIDCAKSNELKQKGVRQSGAHDSLFYEPDDGLFRIEF